MYRILMLFAFSALALSACKPTPRTAITKQRPAQQEQQGENAPAKPDRPTPEDTTPTTPPPAEAPQTAEADIAASLLTIRSTRQDFNRMRPWEKNASSTTNFIAAYLGEGKVLTFGAAAQAATYVEIALPDGSRSVPARVLRYDRDLNLALLSPVHAEDAGIFESRKPLELGDALKPGDEAACDTLVRGIFPVRIPLQAENGVVAEVHPVPELKLPRLSLRSAQPLPEGTLSGLPVLSGGKLVGMATGGNRDTQSLHCINAELIARFLAAQDGEHAGSPLIGIDTTELDDPVFRAYLKLGNEQGGIYLNEVIPGSSAEQAGLQEGDVIIAIEGQEIDNQGRCRHPLYGLIDATAVMSSLKPVGETLALTVSRQGEQLQLALPLRRQKMECGLPDTFDAPGKQPRYALWGGLLFQPLTQDFFTTLAKRSKGALPVPLIEIASREKEFLEKGVTELVLLTQVIPTPATLSYESVGGCLVEKVNGRDVHNFAEFVRLLDEPTPDGLVALSLNKAPYTIYMDRRLAEMANTAIRRSAIRQLRNLGDEASDGETAAAAELNPAQE